MSEIPISNNKENKNASPSPPWTPLAKRILFRISLINMEILIFLCLMVLSIIIKKIKNLPPPDTPLIIFFHSISLNKYVKINIYIYISNVYLV